MSKPLMISFAVIPTPSEVRDWGAQGDRLIILWWKPIDNAIAGRPATHCYAVGQDENGKQFKFTTLIKTMQDAMKNPVYFVEASDVRAGVGTLRQDGKNLKVLE